MKRKLKYLILILAFATNMPEVKAQMTFDTLQLSELEILGKKTDYYKTVKQTTIDTLIKQESDYKSLGEILGVYTPVYVKSYGRGALSTASFRGTGASHTQVYWNDFVINSPMLGQLDFSLIPNSFIDEIELFYGGGSLIKSNGALGGGVSLNNSAGFNKSTLLSIEQAVGSFGYVSTAAGINLGNETFSSVTRFSNEAAKNDFTFSNTAISPPQEVTQKNADYRNTGFMQQFSYKPGQNHLIIFSSWNQWNKRNIPTIMTNLENGADQTEQQKDIFSRNLLSWVYHKNRAKLEVRGAYFYTDMQYLMETAGQGDKESDTTIDSKNKTNSFFGKVKFDYSFKHGISLTGGFDIDIEQVNTNNYESLRQRNTASLFALFVKDFRSRFKLSLLLRGVMMDGKVLPPLPLLGINYKLLYTEEFYIRASVSKNYHLPTLNDLYWNPGGNPELKQEDATELEIGVNYKKAFPKGVSLDLDLSAYASKIKDWIQWIPSEYGYWSPQNINEVFARGAEFSISINGKKDKFIYKILGQYAFTRTTNESQYAKDEGFSGRQMIYIPVHSGSGYVYGSYRGYFLNWTVNFVGERNTSLNADSDISSKMPAFVLNNFSLGKRFYWGRTNLNLRFIINNIFDVDYQSVLWRAMPGRNYEIILKFELKHKK